MNKLKGDMNAKQLVETKKKSIDFGAGHIIFWLAQKSWQQTPMCKPKIQP